MIIQKIRTFLSLSSVAGAVAVIKWKVLPKNTVFTANISGINVRVRARTSDLLIAIECLTSEYNSIAKLFPASYNGVIIDAGGHIGCASLRLANFFPKARIICIEPSSDNLKILRENTRHVSEIEVRAAALVQKSSGRIALSDRGMGGSGYTVIKDSDVREANILPEKVDTVSIDELFEEFGNVIGFVKIDIEGAERDILASPSFRNQDIPAVFVELHDRINPGCTEAFDTFSKGRWNLRLGSEKYLSLSRTPRLEEGEHPKGIVGS